MPKERKSKDPGLGVESLVTHNAPDADAVTLSEWAEHEINHGERMATNVKCYVVEVNPDIARDCIIAIPKPLRGFLSIKDHRVEFLDLSGRTNDDV